MSRIAKSNINIPENVFVKLSKQHLTVEGKHGKIKKKINSNIKIKQENNILSFFLDRNYISKKNWAQAGTTRSLINNMIIGVNKLFSKKLKLVGVGYKVRIDKNIVFLSIGYSHIINYKLPHEVYGECLSNNEILLSGIDKQLVFQVAAKIRSYRIPEVYKGKGIRYDNEFIKIKETKKKK